MFSGIVETTGIVNKLEPINDCLKINISSYIKFTDLRIGDSVSINGVCLTVTHFTDNDFDATVVPETLRLTNLSAISPGSLVNLERSLRVGDRIGGHYVQGHVDAMADIIDINTDGKDALILKLSMPQNLSKYIVKKGYIGLDGMSITVIEVTNDWFTVTLIPHTREVSIASDYTIGTKINIEVDILGKYVEKMLRSQ